MLRDKAETDSSIYKNQRKSLPAEIVPLRRLQEMDSGDGGKDEIPTKQSNDAASNPDMYPGFGRLFSQQLRNNAVIRGDGFESINSPDEGNEYVDQKIAPNQEERKVAACLKKPPPENRKRRRPSEEHESNNHTKQHREKSQVHHEYHDYSGLSGDFVLPALKQKGRGGVSSMFPTVLHHMLDEAERQGFSHIVSWQPHGRAFHVHLPERFVAEVMPNYFRHTRLSSFQRQLSLYGFTRLARKGPDRGAYYHECFLRGLVHLCTNIQRTRVKGTMVRQSSSPETEPDFSVLPPVGVDHAKSTSSLFSARGLQVATVVANRLDSGKTEGQHGNANHATSAPQLAYNDIMLRNLQDPPRSALPTSQDPFDLKDKRARSENLRNEMSQPPPPAPRAWGSKYMRHLLTRTLTPQGEQQEGSNQEGNAEETQPSNPETEVGSQGSGGSSKSHAKIDAESDLAVFLEEVDLDTDEDECLESEEAMARILEQEVNQISEV
ncbi:Heat stress transcription factor [Seminavis robusta]|uniref:Heat stress transcription factor n=1 Tax=Seminavis robusta TaxID=568900 RepID=A0A9N8ET94_9STRA|nr:Heat stress transcription factor [Seminavis robusta]|eukprot:Sro1900_g304270.1 Heat stress transcription factor (493) ;mRNA; r:15083-16842